MYNEISNYLGIALSSDEEFKKLSETVLLELFNSNNKTYAKNEDFEAKLFNNKKNNVNYLIVKKDGYLNVYKESSVRQNPFQYTIKELKSGALKVNGMKIISLELSEQNETTKIVKLLQGFFNGILAKDEEKEFYELYEKLKADKELYEKLIKIVNLSEKEYFCTSSPYKLKIFYEYLYEQGLITEKVSDSKWIEKTKVPNDMVAEDLKNLKNDVNFLFDVCIKKNFNNKRKYSYNDKDNSVYLMGNNIVLESQGMLSYITMKNDEITIYACDKENEGYLKHNTLSSLLLSIEKNEDSLLDNVIFKSKGNSVEYININSWYCLSKDLEYTRENIINEGILKTKKSKLTK